MSQHQDPQAPNPRFAPKVEDADDLIAQALAAVESRLNQSSDPTDLPEPMMPRQAVEIELDPRAFDNTIPPDDGDSVEPEAELEPRDPSLIFDPGAWGEPPPSAVDEANARVQELSGELEALRNKLAATREKGRRLNERHQTVLQSWQQLKTDYEELRGHWIRQDRELNELRAALRQAEVDRDRQRTRHNHEVEEVRRFSNSGLLKELLPVLDNLDISLAHTDSSPAHAAEGLRMIASQLVRTLERFGVTRVEGAVGERFDPNLHEAIAYQASAEVAAGCIYETHQGGWLLNGRLIRPARVSVARAEPTPPTAPPNPESTGG